MELGAKSKCRHHWIADDGSQSTSNNQNSDEERSRFFLIIRFDNFWCPHASEVADVAVRDGQHHHEEKVPVDKP